MNMSENNGENSGENNGLKMKFDPNVIEHLGVRMYSTLPPVLSELIANAYDADAKEVSVELHDKGDKKIVVKDDGIGMSSGDIQTKFLFIGRNRRKDGDEVTPGGRSPIGKKGLGKLSFFGIVQTITVDTVKDKKRNVFVMDWDMLMASETGTYLVDHPVRNEPVVSKNGTTVTLTNIKRKSNFVAESVARGISRFFIFDKEFCVYVQRNDDSPIKVEDEMRFDQLDPEFVWNFPEDLKNTDQYRYLKKHDIKGMVVTSRTPIRPSMKARGIVLFSRQKLVQAPSHFSEGTSSHFFSYLSGSLAVDFIDDLPEDVISTNRQSLNWENPAVEKLGEVLRDCISHIQKKWREKRKEQREKHIGEKILPGWYESMPAHLRKAARGLIENIESISSLGEEEMAALVDSLLKVIPHYPVYHWRHLHRRLQQPLLELYKKREYLTAAEDGTQIYEKVVRDKSQLSKIGAALFQHAFGEGKPLQIQHPFDTEETNRNIQNGQQFLSVGLANSFRNPVAHSPREDHLDFFTEDDCLDVLSLISFLLRRVDKAKKAGPAKQSPKPKKS